MGGSSVFILVAPEPVSKSRERSYSANLRNSRNHSAYYFIFSHVFRHGNTKNSAASANRDWNWQSLRNFHSVFVASNIFSCSRVVTHVKTEAVDDARH